MDDVTLRKLDYIADVIQESQSHLYKPEAVRLVKLIEEVGEVSQAYIGTVGANPRKGKYASESDVVKELVDVIVTAFVAMYDWCDDPHDAFVTFLDVLFNRVQREGS